MKNKFLRRQIFKRSVLIATILLSKNLIFADLDKDNSSHSEMFWSNDYLDSSIDQDVLDSLLMEASQKDFDSNQEIGASDEVTNIGNFIPRNSAGIKFYELDSSEASTAAKPMQVGVDPKQLNSQAGTNPQQIIENKANLKPTIHNTAVNQQITPSSGQAGIVTTIQQPPTEPELEETAISAVGVPKPEAQKTILINFNNVGIIEYIRFISRISNRNFVFDENDLQFTVTIVSEEPTTIDNIMTALLQELRVHDLSLLEQGNNLIIHKNPKVGTVSKVVTEEVLPGKTQRTTELITKVFRLNTIEADKAAAILRPLVSDRALVEVLKETNNLIVTDLTANIEEIGRLLKSVDSPQSGLVIGQYVVRNAFLDTLISLGQQIMQPIAGDQKLLFVPHAAVNSIFIISTPYLVERTISVLQYLDQNQGITRILNPKELKHEQEKLKEGMWELDNEGNWRFRPASAGVSTQTPPSGKWSVDQDGNWFFQPGVSGAGEKGPAGQWILDENGNWVYKLASGKSISASKISRNLKTSSDLPPGNIERTQFYIHKLRYRNGDQISQALYQIAQSLQATGTTNADLVSTINSVQWLEGPNSLVFTGTPESLDKVKQLIDEIDTPLRQVFLDMLIMEVTLDDTLDFSVNLSTRFGGGLTSGNQAFLSGASTLPGAMSSAGVTIPTPPPNTSVMAQLSGFTLGVVGEHISFNGTLFSTIGALVKASHTRSTMKVVMNPKILTEDNSPAEIFVGENTQYPTQSIANDRGSIVTQNFEFRDVGTRLKITPLISNNNTITLDIQEEVSSIISGGTTSNNLSTQVIGPTTSVNRTTTKVHVPNKFFLVLSGNLQDTETRRRIQTPCLGSIPIIGAAFSDKEVVDAKRNLMIFIRPEIIDTEAEINDLTKRNQDMFRVKNRILSNWKYEYEEALDFFNLEDTEDSDGEQECF